VAWPFTKDGWRCYGWYGGRKSLGKPRSRQNDAVGKVVVDFSQYTELENINKEDRRLEGRDRRGRGPKTGRSVREEDMTGSSKNMPSI
jgi:hypothetical protein